MSGFATRETGQVNVKTYRAKSMKDALHMVWHEMGPDAKVISTQRKLPGLLGRLVGRPTIEVTAIVDSKASEPGLRAAPNPTGGDRVPPAELDCRDRLKRLDVHEQTSSLLESMVEAQPPRPSAELPATLFSLFTDLIEAEVDDDFARKLIEDVKQHSTPAELASIDKVRERSIELLLRQVRVTPAIQSNSDRRRVVALVGPTGVGKTTTIAKIAANLRLREKSRVGLITVDTYRIAAVDQLRAYAEIIDLPMEVVTTPREMREAVAKLAELDIVLIDTAGRSPQDGIQIQELKAMLTEARTDEIHLVLSAVAHSKHLVRLVDRFRVVNPTSLLLTKLDEAMCWGNLLSVICSSQLPMSYTTHGQNVPKDIQPADPKRLLETVVESSFAATL